MYKIVDRIANIVMTLVLIIAIALIGILLVPKAFHYNVYAVLSGSMEPYYHVGSIVYIKKTPPEDISINNPIAYHFENDKIVTHRVVAIDKEKELITTKGDANDTNDVKPVAYSQVIGVGKATIPYIGYISMNIKTKKGIFICAAILISLVVLELLVEILKPTEKKGSIRIHSEE
ncbi:MAG: signal peptidase I [bacterium]|nr:signal peptidase I [bacterium]